MINNCDGRSTVLAVAVRESAAVYKPIRPLASGAASRPGCVLGRGGAAKIAVLAPLAALSAVF